MYLADVPRCVIRSASTKSQRILSVARERRTVVEQQRSAGGEPRRKPVPHHPAAGREKEQPVAGLDVAVQPMLFDVLQQRAARAVDDAFRHARRAGRIEDVERMIERQALGRERSRRERSDEVVPG